METANIPKCNAAIRPSLQGTRWQSVNVDGGITLKAEAVELDLFEQVGERHCGYANVGNR